MRTLQSHASLPPLHRESLKARLQAGLRATDHLHFELAERIFEELLKEQPQWVGAWIRLAHALHGQGRLTEAEEALRTALDLDARSQVAHRRLGELLWREFGEEENGREHLDTAHRLDPKSEAGRQAAELLKDLDQRATA